MDELQSTLFWLRLAQVLIAVPLLALAGQGATSVLARIMGQPPEQNAIYRLFRFVASPAVKPCRFIAPRFIPDRHLPLVAFSLLAVAYGWVMIEIASLCLRHGLTITQCLQSS
jgi:hypothetical protein